MILGHQEEQMTIVERMSEADYEAFVRTGAAGVWELHGGRLVQKPALSSVQREIVSRLARQLLAQLDAAEYEVRVNDCRVRGPDGTIHVPDLLVVPGAHGESSAGRSGVPILAKPVPFVVEVWRPADSGYDVDARISVYQQRGDLEIWLLHPLERSLTSWVRQADGTYTETIYQVGAALPAPRVGGPIDRGPRFDA